MVIITLYYIVCVCNMYETVLIFMAHCPPQIRIALNAYDCLQYARIFFIPYSSMLCYLFSDF